MGDWGFGGIGKIWEGFWVDFGKDFWIWVDLGGLMRIWGGIFGFGGFRNDLGRFWRSLWAVFGGLVGKALGLSEARSNWSHRAPPRRRPQRIHIAHPCSLLLAPLGGIGDWIATGLPNLPNLPNFGGIGGIGGIWVDFAAPGGGPDFSHRRIACNKPTSSQDHTRTALGPHRERTGTAPRPGHHGVRGVDENSSVPALWPSGFLHGPESPNS